LVENTDKIERIVFGDLNINETTFKDVCEVEVGNQIELHNGGYQRLKCAISNELSTGN